MISLKKQWFTLAIFAVISVAYLVSLTNFSLPAASANLIKFSLIICIFLLSGLTIDSSKLLHSIKNWQLHLWIQIISFLIFPAVILVTAFLTDSNDLGNLIYVGFIVLACIPTTITSCVVFTRNADGNEEASLFNATLGNILGIFITPLLIYFLIGETIHLDPIAAIKKLTLLVILPFLIGQIGRNFLSIKVSPALAKNGSNWMILAIMFIAFINAFDTGINLSFIDFVYILILSLVLKLVLTAATWYGSALNSTRFSLPDRKCLTITATQKTLALGLPIVTVLFANNPNLAVISFPIIAYHTVQLIIDGVLVSYLAQIK